MAAGGAEMNRPRTAISLAAATILLAVIALVTGYTAPPDFDDRLGDITEGFCFDFVSWEIDALDEELDKIIGGVEVSVNSTDEVLEYFAGVARIKRLEAEVAAVNAGTLRGDLLSLENELEQQRQVNAEMAGSVERTIEAQIREALNELDINSPLERYVGNLFKFPPVNFIIDTPPHLLVISPRDEINTMREIALLPDLTVEDMERIEAEADKLGVSSLVVRLGGISTYPNFVSNTSSLQFTLSTASEEWLHQYLAFTPLGFRYLLDLTGIKRDYEIATMNETVAGIVSKEIGAIIYDKYYAVDSSEAGTSSTTTPEFDFNKEMREIRKAVDDYLAAGDVVRAEEFMEQKRQYLAENGYYIRKLNQAYFAFHGAYADSPTSVSPIGAEFSELRSRSISLKDFLDIAAAMTGREDLIKSIE
jgi:BMFP domain-containing protein YqiC